MPVHYDPARIRKRFCPQGHDKYVVGVRNRKCRRCDNDRITKRQTTPGPYRDKYLKNHSNGWQNPKRALRDYQRSLRIRMEVKREKIAELEKELETYASQK